MSRGCRWLPAAAPLLLVAACATARTPTPAKALAATPAPVRSSAVVTRQVVVKVPVKTACVPKALPAPPRYPDSETALRGAGGAADRYQLLAAGRLLRARRLAVLERVIEGCR